MEDANKSRFERALELAERARDEAFVTADKLIRQVGRHDADRTKDDGEKLLLALRLLEVASEGRTATAPNWTKPKSPRDL